MQYRNVKLFEKKKTQFIMYVSKTGILFFLQSSAVVEI